MPVLSDLDHRLDSNSEQKKNYENNLPQASKMADKMLLVHVTGNIDRPFLELIIDSNNKLLTSKSHENEIPLSNTILAEDRFGLGRCLYLYAGRACPDFGTMALAFPPGIEATQNGSVTPFDTGGLYKGYILPLASEPLDKRKEFALASLFDLATWRSAFAQFAAAYFASLPDYWTGKPAFDDPEHILMDSSNQWQAWTFEVHFHEAVSIWNYSAWSSSKDQYESFRQEVLTPGRSSVEIANIRRFMSEGHYVEPTKPRIFTDEFELWIREQIF